MPRKSGRRVSDSSRDSGSTRSPTTSAAMPTGMLTRKIQRHDASTSRPPMGGPRAAATPRPSTTRRSPATGAPGGTREQQGQRRRRDHGAARRLHHPEGDQAAHAPGERAAQRPGEERRQPGEEDLAPADAVGDPAGRCEQRGEDDRVAVEHPGQRPGRVVSNDVASVGNAMLTMNRSSAERNTAAETTSRTSPGLRAGDVVGGCSVAALMAPRLVLGSCVEPTEPDRTRVGSVCEPRRMTDRLDELPGPALLHRGRAGRGRRPLGAARRARGLPRRRTGSARSCAAPAHPASS